jgi:protein-disulfide isomerase
MDLKPQTIALIIGGSILSIFALFGVYSLTTTPSKPAPALDLKVTSKDWITGTPSSKKVVVEYSDFQCPACKAYEPMVEQLIAKHSKDIAFVYRHFPLPQHKNSTKGALAAEAAGVQGKFWEMHNMLFENQDSWAEKSNPQDEYVSYAKKLKLNIDQFTKDMDSDVLKKKIDMQSQSGEQVGVNSTPSFFVNGIKLETPRTLSDFEDALK